MTYTQRKTKYRAKRTEYNGEVYDAKLESGVAYQLDMRLRAGEIAAVERQFQVVCIPYTRDGRAVPALSVRHKVDFRIKHLDDSYELVEAKGLELSDYRTRRRWLEAFWLPEHPDHTYTVIKDSGSGRGLRWSKKP